MLEINEWLRKESASLMANPNLTLDQKRLFQQPEYQTDAALLGLIDSLNHHLVAERMAIYNHAPQLSILDFSDLGLTRVPMSLCAFLENRTHVTRINFKNNCLYQVPEAIFALERLEYLNLNQNHLNKNEMQAIADLYKVVKVEFSAQKSQQDWQEIDIQASPVFTPQRETFEMAGPEAPPAPAARRRHRRCDLI